MTAKNPNRSAKPTKPAADPTKPSKPKRILTKKASFFEGVINGLKVRAVLEQHAPHLIPIFPIAYEEQSTRKRAAWNSLEAVERRAAELRAKQALLTGVATELSNLVKAVQPTETETQTPDPLDSPEQL